MGKSKEKMAATSGSGSVPKQTKKSNPKTPRVILNRDYEIRLDMMNAKNEFIAERGINLEELGGTPIPNVLRRIKWETYVSQPPPYKPEIVREFFVAMIPDYFQARGSV
ncbi:hypothetical protein Ddye_022519 [Dipteronia dyeriana]|uniref:Uncharacterized protein n=1 Tax=Dipteronia dyeriana TaxID=168575 RepID=A0AAD9WRI5_9ROSI|nr:hypothetical protein Ddye_022519 [Dipteronia dyeriana]